MPGFDRTGLIGRGPMTGWGRGNYIMPGWVVRGPIGDGGGFGRAHGWRHRFWSTGVPGWTWWRRPYPYGIKLQPEEELEILQDQARYLEKDLEEIRKNIAELKTKESQEKTKSKD